MQPALRRSLACAAGLVARPLNRTAAIRTARRGVVDQALGPSDAPRSGAGVGWHGVARPPHRRPGSSLLARFGCIERRFLFDDRRPEAARTHPGLCPE